MWLPLAFQVKYLDFYICFIAYCVVPREFLWPQVIMFDIMSFKLVHSIRNSLYAKRSLHLLINFMFGDDRVISNEFKVVITQGFSFICFRTVEACTPY